VISRLRFRVCSLFLPIVFAAALAYGQNDRATVTGTVTDPTGASLPGAQVTLTEVATGTITTAASNNNGIYTVPGLPVGTYTLAISNPGFNDYKQTGIILVTAQVLEVNVHMTVGSSAQTVTVTGGAPLLDAETSTVATTLEQQAIRDLPLNAFGGQDAMNLMLAVTPGTTGTNGSNQDFVAFAGAQP
jgi:Carboxypeptidase regulatory-like domain